jgi:eukaryotic-like serine/threonine-protein kinase
VSLEGYAYMPTLSPDGQKIYYRILKGGTSPFLGASELWVADIATGKNEPLLSGFVVTGYDLSQDGRRVVFSALDPGGKNRLWVAPTDRTGAPHQVAGAEGDMPFFGPPGELVFHSIEGKGSFAFRINEDGTGRQKLISSEITQLQGISSDGKLVIASTGVNGQKVVTKVFPISGAPPTPVLAGLLCFLRWQPDGRFLYLSVSTGMNTALASGRTYVIPLAPGKVLPKIPPDGFRSEADMAVLPGVRVINAADMAPGNSPATYAFSRQTVQRNLYRIPLP